jgi:hypothetical protein
VEENMPLLNHVISIILLLSSFSMFGRQENPLGTLRQTPKQDLTLIGIRLQIYPADLRGRPGEKPFQVGSKVRVKVIVRNDSDQRVVVRTVDPYYQDRPRLFRNSQLVSYRAKIAELVRAKDASPEFVSLNHFVSVNPYSSADLEELDLNDWYGLLEPGSYRLINRYRLDIDGPWTADSEPLLFEVVSH